MRRQSASVGRTNFFAFGRDKIASLDKDNRRVTQKTKRDELHYYAKNKPNTVIIESAVSSHDISEEELLADAKIDQIKNNNEMFNIDGFIIQAFDQNNQNILIKHQKPWEND